MPWTWRYEKADGSVITTDELQEAIFASQGDAESWLGENWRALLAAGVDQVLAAQRGQDRIRPDDPAPGRLNRVQVTAARQAQASAPRGVTSG